MTEKEQTELIGNLALDIMYHRMHLPLVDGKANRDKIEEEITIGIYNKELVPLSQEIVDLAIACVNDMIDEFGVDV